MSVRRVSWSMVFMLASSGCYTGAAVLIGVDASEHDAGTDAFAADSWTSTPCFALCDACGLSACGSVCGSACAEAATSSGVCEAMFTCAGETPPDAGLTPNEPPPGVIVCGGRICAEGEECCLLDGRCAPIGDPTCVPPAGTTIADACVRNSDCAADELCEADFAGGVVYGRGTCAGIVGQCVVRRPSSDCPGESVSCGCDGRTYPTVCLMSQAGVRLAHDGECSTDIRSIFPSDVCRSDADCAIAGWQHLRCNLETHRCVHADPIIVCGVDAQCPDGEQCCGLTGRCYDPSRAASCAVPAMGSWGPCADDVDCARIDGSYWATGPGSGPESYCDGPGTDGACGTSGSCRPIELDCSTIDDAPVCGCDGATYDNWCVATQSAMRVAHDGACGP